MQQALTIFDQTKVSILAADNVLCRALVPVDRFHTVYHTHSHLSNYSIISGDVNIGTINICNHKHVQPIPPLACTMSHCSARETHILVLYYNNIGSFIQGEGPLVWYIFACILTGISSTTGWIFISFLWGCAYVRIPLFSIPSIL